MAEHYLTDGDPLLEVGDHWIALDSAGRPGASCAPSESKPTCSWIAGPDQVRPRDGRAAARLRGWCGLRRIHLDLRSAEQIVDRTANEDPCGNAEV